MRKISIVIFIFIFQYIYINAQVKLYCDKKQSSISYSMNHPLHSWTGECKEVTSIILTDQNRSSIKQVAVSVKIASFDSKNANRDSHAMEVTEALKYPNVTFESNSIKQDGEKLTIRGTLAFHGISQVITFDAVEHWVNKNKFEISGDFSIQMTQFNIEPPSLLGLATDDDIKIQFKMVY